MSVRENLAMFTEHMKPQLAEDFSLMINVSFTTSSIFICIILQM